MPEFFISQRPAGRCRGGGAAVPWASGVVDADLADYFGSIPHADLLKSVARRVVDRRVLHLIKMWLDCPVEETDDRGRKTRTLLESGHGHTKSGWNGAGHSGELLS